MANGFTSLKRCRKKWRNLTETISDLQSLKYLLSDPSWKKFANLWLKTAVYFAASLVAQTVENLPAVWETWGQSLGQEDPL